MLSEEILTGNASVQWNTKDEIIDQINKKREKINKKREEKEKMNNKRRKNIMSLREFKCYDKHVKACPGRY